jgi:PAS domain S-box-containing protein
MPHTSIRWTNPLYVRSYAVGLVLFWTVVVGALLYREVRDDLDQEIEQARLSSRIITQRDRFWLTEYAHVYVPIEEVAHLHPGFLNDLNHRGTTAFGDTLVLVSPALLAQSVGNRTAEDFGIVMRTVSLTLPSRRYAPDRWEKRALGGFDDSGRVSEFSSLDTVQGRAMFRYMAAVYSDSSCQQCHAEQGLQKGDVLGGISLAIPLDSMLVIASHHRNESILNYFLVWLVGTGLLFVGARRLRERIKERDFALDAQLTSEAKFRDVWEQSRDGMRLLDEQGMIIQVNEAFCRLVRRPRESLVGSHATIVSPPEQHDALRESIRQSFSKDPDGTVTEFRLDLWNGERVPTERSDAIINLSPNERVLLSIFRDLTDRKRVEADLRVSEERLKLERLRTQISSDIHDEIGSTLSSSAIFADMIGQEAGEAGGRIHSLAVRVARDLRRVQDSLHDIVWSLNPDNDLLQNITLRIHEHAVDRLEPLGIRFSIEATPEISGEHLPMAARRHFYLIFKEAVNNIVKHAGCTRVDIRIDVIDRKLVMTIKDDGKGFEQSALTSGNGLRNMKRRAAEINAAIEMKSAPGDGTTLVLSVPVGSHLSPASAVTTSPRST